MAWNGSGVFSRTNGVNTGSQVWQDDAASGTGITAALADTHDEDIATAINACITQNNENKPTSNFDPATTSNLDMGDDSLRWQHVYAEGVNFPATQVASGDANTLDDYQEGTFTPVISDGTNNATSSVATAAYTKVGNIVYFTGTIALSSLGSVSGGIRITGLPVASRNSANLKAAVQLVNYASLGTGANVGVWGYINPNEDFIRLEVESSAGETTNMTESDFSANGSTTFSGHYFV